jgi:hypothetical protein
MKLLPSACLPSAADLADVNVDDPVVGHVFAFEGA